MGRLIDADVLAELLKREAELHESDELFERSYGVLDAYMDVLDAPTIDAVPVIRCKDCKYNRNPPSAGNALCDNFYGMTDQNGFCHFGERRTDGKAD